MITFSFLFFLLLFLVIGIASVFKSRKTAEDYLVAGKSVPAWLTGLSAIATNNSGFMFIGMIGMTYVTGLYSVWLMTGWIIGDLTASLLTLNKLHLASRSSKIHSFGGLLAHWHGDDNHLLRRIIGVLTVLFLTLYAAAQLKAGSKATSVLLNWTPDLGTYIGAVIVLVYSAAGGLRASIWTDAAQSAVMLAGMGMLIFGGIELAGGWSHAITAMSGVSPMYTHWFPDTDMLGVILFITGWFFGGVAVIGQPHIVIRFISLDNASNLGRMRLYYYSWFTLFYGATILTGMLSRIVFPENATFDAELALPKMAQQILPDILVGLVLAALFAATLSTTDSLILSCSAAVTRDFVQHPGRFHSLWVAKFTTASVLGCAVLIALSGAESVFTLVLDAWGLLGSAFAPLVILHAFGHRIPQTLSISMIITGISAFLIWQQLGNDTAIYSVAPGITAGLLIFYLGKRFFLNDAKPQTQDE
jgi:SSS family transporter